MPLALRGRDTEAGMLSGISRKRKIRSNLYWFTEFCNSQCLSHFAAPFIVVRAETSVAESCKQLFQWGSPPDDVTVVPKHFKVQEKLGSRSEAGRQSNSTLLPSSFQARASMPYKYDTSILARSLTREMHSGSFGCVRMILPQVHLRKPCYDFSFL